MSWRVFRLSRHLDSMKGVVRSRRAPFGASLSAVRLPYCWRLTRSSFSRPTRFLVLYSMALFFFYPVCCDSCIGSACEPFSVLFIWINYLLFLKIIGLTDHWLIDFICFQASLFKLHLQKKKELHKSVWCVLQKKVQVHVDMWCRFPELAFLLHLLECDDTAVTVTWHGTFLYLRYSLWHTIMYWH